MTYESPPSAVDERRRNHFPIWIKAAIILLVVVQINDYTSSNAPRSSGGRHRPSISTQSDIDDQSLDDLFSTDLYAKFSFVVALLQNKPDPQYLKRALDAAAEYDNDSSNSPSAARRLMILRALSDKPPLAKTKKGYSPLDAFGSALPSDILPVDRQAFAAEGRLWAAAFGAKTPNVAELLRLSSEVRSAPNLRWWEYPAMTALYAHAGDTKGSARYMAIAGNAAIPSVAGTVVVMLLRLVMILVGVGMIAVMIVSTGSRWMARSQQGAEASSTAHVSTLPDSVVEPQAFGIWKAVPAALTDSDRKLTAPDLLGVFILYLVTRELLMLVLSGFDGFGHRRLLHFSGIIAPFVHQLSSVPVQQRLTLSISIESIVYILTALPSIAWLFYLARSRNTSLFAEIGLGRRGVGRNMLYGLGGFCISQPLVVVVGLLAPWFFRHFPAPSNPVIPQLVSVTSLAASIVLVALASIAAPFVEEILFRGALYQAIRIRTGPWPAIILSGFVFGFMHPVGISEMFPLAVLGCVFAWMAETRKSLIPSMTAHCINNFTTSLLLIFLTQL